VGVAIGRATVGSPPGVPYSGGALGDRGPARVGQRLVQVGQLPGPLLGDQPVLGEHRHTGRVIPSVLQPAQPVHHDAQRRTGAGVTHDPTHAPYRSGVPLSMLARSRLLCAVDLLTSTGPIGQITSWEAVRWTAPARPRSLRVPAARPAVRYR